MQVSVIIVNYNTKHLLKGCLNSLYEQTQGLSFEVIVVDNNSQDGSKEYITSRFGGVVWIDSGENLGFGRANNLGARVARGEYLFLLNSDTILLNNSIGLFYDYMRRNLGANLGAIGGWLLDCEGGVNYSYGLFPSAVTEIKYLFEKLLPRGTSSTCHPTQKDVDFISGADLFISRALFEQFEGFDPHIFMYYEETDLQLRMSKCGYVRRLIPSPRIIHLEGGSFRERGGVSFSRFMMSQRSFNYYIHKHYSALSRLLFRATMIPLRLTLWLQPWTLGQRAAAYSLVITGKF